MPVYRHKIYNLLATKRFDDLRALEMFAFRVGHRIEDGGLGKYGHFKNYCKSALPSLIWNDWVEKQFQSLCNEEYAYRDGESVVRVVNWTGCGAAGKTFSAGVYAMLWFACLPHQSAVTLVSSSKDMIKKRVWPVIQNVFHELQKGDYRFGHLIDSRMVMQAEKGADKTAISAKAIRGGDLTEAVENIKGLHAPRLMLIIDEAPGVPTPIWEAIPNLRTGCQDLTILVIGNAISHLDPHGRCCEPKDGWPSVNVESEMWATKGIREWALPPGVCVHFDGHKSPNVVAGQTLYPFIYTMENYRESLRNAGGQQTIQLWSQNRGFWAPSGVLNTVFDETMVERFDGRGKFTWQTFSENIASLDPAFGGDGCIFQAGEYGDLPSGRFGVQLKDWINIQSDPTSKEPIDHQIAHRVMKECDRRRIRPERFAMDATGTGRGVYAILRSEWGEVLRVEFGGAPSDKPASSHDPRPSNEVYDRRVSELWYSAREFLCTEQLKGLYEEAIVQACSREYTMKMRKIVLDTKEDCKKKIGRSPDHFDAVAVLTELARSLGAVAGNYQKQSTRWETEAKKFDEVYDQDDVASSDPVEDHWEAA